MITICHLGVSQSDRVVWLMEELGLPYQLEWYDRGEDMLAPPEFRALHPSATAPLIKDDDLVLVESVAIVEYISNRYAGGRFSIGAKSDNYANYLYWMQLNNNLQSAFFAKVAAGEDANEDNMMVKVSNRRMDGCLSALESRLGEADYLAGNEFSNTEIMAMFPLTTLVAFAGITFEGKPNTQAYIDRVSQRPAYIKAMEIAGPEAKRP